MATQRLLGALVGLNLLDVGLTWLALRAGLFEINPGAVWLMASIGFWSTATIKMGVIALVGWWCSPSRRALWAMTSIMVVLALWNIFYLTWEVL